MAKIVTKKVYWLGTLKDECNMCRSSFKDVMYDAALPHYGGMWGCVCKRCFIDAGGKTGLGFGQRYDKQKDGKWLKVAG